MKFNLKNRPRPDLPSVEYVREAILWFLRFERELREEIAYLKSMEPEELYEYIHEFKFEREVLGE